MNSEPEQNMELIGVKSLAKKRGYQIDNLERKNANLLKISSEIIVESGGVLAIRTYRILLDSYERSYQLTEIRPYTNRKGRTFQAHFVGRTYVGAGKKPKYILTWTPVTESNFDENWTVDEYTGLLIPIIKTI